MVGLSKLGMHQESRQASGWTAHIIQHPTPTHEHKLHMRTSLELPTRMGRNGFQLSNELRFCL